MAEVNQRVRDLLQGGAEPVVSPTLEKPPEENFFTPVGRTFEAAGAAVTDLFDAPFGQSEEERQELIDLGLLGTPEQQQESVVFSFNDALISSTVAGVDIAFRTVAAPFVGGLAAVEQAGRELGLTTVQNKAVTGLLESMGLQLMSVGGKFGARPPRAKGRRGRKRIEPTIADKTRAKAGTSKEGEFVVNVQREGLNVNITQRGGKPFATLVEAETFARVIEKEASPDQVVSIAIKQRIGEGLETVPEAQREAVRTRLGQSFDEAQAKLKEELKVGETGLPTRIEEPLSRKVVETAEAALVEGRVKLNKDQPISDQIIQMMMEGRLIADDITKVLKENNISVEEFAGLFGVKRTDAGRTLQAFSALNQRLKKLGILDDELAEMRRLAGFDAFSRMGNTYRRASNIYRALLVSALATATRNAITQGGRVSLAVIERTLEKATERIFLPANARSGEPIQAFGESMRLFRRAKTQREVEFILKAFPRQVSDLFLSFSSDIAILPEVVKGRALSKGEKVLRGAEKAVMLVNVFNRFQEFAFRKAILASVLDRRLRARGTSLTEVIEKNLPENILYEDIRIAIAESFDMTFAKKFSPTAKGFDGLAGKFVALMTNLPGAVFAVPFPRFMMQSLQFQFEFSPLGFANTLRLLSPSRRAAISRGDVKAFNKALIGTTMYLMAWQLRNSEFAGERWHEMKIPDETAKKLGVDIPEGGSAVVSLLSFAPFVTPLFVADIVKRLRDGTLNRLEPRDIAIAVLGMGGRAGTGIATIDSIIDMFTGISDAKDIQLLQKVLGRIASGFLTPINQLRDFVAAFDENAEIVRRGVEAPFTDEILRRLPILDQQLPPLESPTRAAPPRLQAPLLRPFLGMAVRDKNRIERELDRLDFRYRDVSASTRNVLANNAIHAELGPLIEQHLGAFIQTEEYRLLPNDAVRGAVLKEVINRLRAVAREQAEEKNPELFLVLKGEQLPRRQQRAIKSVTGQLPGEIIEESIRGLR